MDLKEEDKVLEVETLRVSTRPFIVEFRGAIDFEIDENIIVSMIQLNLYLYLYIEIGSILKDFEVSILGTQLDDADGLLGSRNLRDLQSRNESLVRALMMTTLDLEGDPESVSAIDVDVATDLVTSYFEGKSVKELETSLVSEGVNLTSIMLVDDNDVATKGEAKGGGGGGLSSVAIAFIVIGSCLVFFAIVFFFLRKRKGTYLKLLSGRNRGVADDTSSQDRQRTTPGPKKRLGEAIVKFTHDVRRKPADRRRSSRRSRKSSSGRSFASSELSYCGTSTTRYSDYKKNLSPHSDFDQSCQFSDLLPPDQEPFNNSEKAVYKNSHALELETEDDKDLFAMAALVGASRNLEQSSSTQGKAKSSSPHLTMQRRRPWNEEDSEDSESNEDDLDLSVYLVPADDSST